MLSAGLFVMIDSASLTPERQLQASMQGHRSHAQTMTLNWYAFVQNKMHKVLTYRMSFYFLLGLYVCFKRFGGTTGCT